VPHIRKVSYLCLQPSLSVGKVGGLAVDLLVSTYGLHRAGWLEDENVLPVASNNALVVGPTSGDGDVSLSTNLEGTCFLKVRSSRGLCALSEIGPSSLPRCGK